MFTGIGGLTQALRGIATPLLYCENDPTRRECLEALMRKGWLPNAPLHDDIRTLETVPACDIVVGGWPCKGWSVVGKHEGFDHDQSALFFEFARVVNACKPALVFQENVPAVLGKKPLETICAALSEYDLVWMTLPAYVVGAPHTRLRWYCLGVRKGSLPQFRIVEPYIRHLFTEAGIPRGIHHGHSTTRLSMLGNAVVPDAARLAFLMLCTGCSREDAWTFEHVHVQIPKGTGRPLGKDSTRRRYGACIDGVLQQTCLATTPPRPDMGLVFVPEAYSSTGTRKADADRIFETPQYKCLWASPRASNVGASGVLTGRSIRDLYTQLRFERRTPHDQRCGYPNPEWVEEYIMGYPRGWTACV